MPFPWALWLCRCAQTTAAVLLAGVAVVRLLAFGTSPGGAGRGTRLAWSCWAVLLASGVLLLGLTASEMSGQPLLRAVADGTVARVLGGTSFGSGWLARMGVLTGWSVVRWLAEAARRRGWPRTAVCLATLETLLDAALLVSLVWAGHARASDKNVWLLPVDAVHALAAGAWPGGLPPLALLLARARRNPSLLPAAVIVTRRVSRLSVAAVGALAFSGLLNGIGMVGTFAALWSSGYGRLVLAKAALFALLVGLGAVNRRLIRRPGPADTAQTVARLWSNVAWECVLAAGVLLVTEALAGSAPPMPPG